MNAERPIVAAAFVFICDTLASFTGADRRGEVQRSSDGAQSSGLLETLHHTGELANLVPPLGLLAVGPDFPLGPTAPLLSPSSLFCIRPSLLERLAMKIRCSHLLRNLAVTGFAVIYCLPSFAQSVPFSGLSGAWAGPGTISLSDGSREHLRCRATYRVNGPESGLQQTLRCASDSYRFDLSSDVVSQGGRISGTWSESNRNISGSLEGRASGGHILATVSAPGFSANLTLTTLGNHQSVSIVSRGNIRNVSISMVRS